MRDVEIAEALERDPMLKSLAEQSIGVGNTGSESARESQATRLIRLVESSGAELFHDRIGDAFATAQVGSHRETMRIDSRIFRRWLSLMFYQSEAKAPAPNSLASVIPTLEAKAAIEGQSREVFLRVAGFDGRVYLDLCDEGWNAIEISANGWKVIESGACPVRFRRSRGMLAIPRPEHGGKIKLLGDLLNLGGENDFKLAVAWLVGALHPSGPYPVLALHGEQGSGKTLSSTMLRSLIDPGKPALRAEPREVRDLMIAASSAWVCAYDNLSTLWPWLSDALCRLSTGGGFGTRTLYSDQDETIFDAKRPILLTGIEEIIIRGDLADRTIVIYLPEIDGKRRKDEIQCLADFELARPRVLGSLLDAVAGAIADAGSVRLETLPRMADFALWVTAGEKRLGWKGGDFIRAYNTNRHDVNNLPLETPLCEAIQKLPTSWTGTATELLARLESIADERVKRMKAWPASPRSLSNALRRLAPNLREAGISVEFGRREPGTGNRLIRVISAGETSSHASQTDVASQVQCPESAEPKELIDEGPGCDKCDANSPALHSVTIAPATSGDKEAVEWEA